jgi:hypothetical protein
LQKAAAQLISEVPLWAWIQSVAPSGLSHAPSVSLLILVFAGVSFLAYVIAVLAVWNRRTGVAPVATAVLASVILFQTSVWYLPNESTDLYNYILRGRIAAVYGSNPYFVAADEFPQDPIYPFASHRYTSFAGSKFPTWLLVNMGLTRIAGDDPVRNVFTYRTAFFLFNLANLALIASILARIAPQRLLFGIVLFGFNPIVFTYGQSKTDTVIVFFLLSSIWLLSRARHRLAVVFLGMSVLVKLITAPLLVVHLLREFRTCGWRATVWSAALLTLTVAALYAPFTRTPDLILSHIFIASENADGSGSGPILKWGLLLLCVLLGLWRKDGLESLLRTWAVVLLYFSFFLTSFAMSWYMLTLIAVMSLVGDWRLVCAACALVFSSNTINSWHHTSSPLFPLASPIPLSRQLAYFLPLGVLATSIFVALLHRRHRERRHTRA